VEESKEDVPLTEEELEAQREKKKYDNYIPPEKRRPPDEFFNLKQMRRTALAIYVVNKDSSLTPIERVKVATKAETSGE